MMQYKGEESMKSGEYLCERTNFIKAADLQEEIYSDLQQAYEKARGIYEQIRVTDLWRGKNKQALLDYMNLILQLHGALIKNGESTKINYSGNNVTQEVAEGLRKAASGVSAIGSESEIVGRLGRII